MDIHKQTAAKLFEVPYEAVTDEQRKFAKTVNYVDFYGNNGYRKLNSMRPYIDAAFNLRNK